MAVRMFQHGIWTGIFAILFVGSIIFSAWVWHDKTSKEEKIIQMSIILKSNEILIRSKDSTIAVYNVQIKKVESEQAKEPAINKQIVDKWKTVYDNLQNQKNAPDTVKYNVLFSLVAKHRETPITRD